MGNEHLAGRCQAIKGIDGHEGHGIGPGNFILGPYNDVGAGKAAPVGTVRVAVVSQQIEYSGGALPIAGRGDGQADHWQERYLVVAVAHGEVGYQDKIKKWIG